MKSFSGEQRQFGRQLKVGTQIGQSDKPGGWATTIYYLEGDERRAIRRFIEVNEEIVAMYSSNTEPIPERLERLAL